MTDYDCKNCSWTLNDNVIQCFDSNTKCDPRCYVFNDNYINASFKGVYDSTVRNDDMTKEDAQQFNDKYNDIKTEPRSDISRDIKFDEYNNLPDKYQNVITNSNGGQCTQDNMKKIITDNCKLSPEAGENDKIACGLELPDVDTDAINELIKNKIGETRINITSNIENTGYQNYETIIPPDDSKNSEWPCKLPDGSDISSGSYTYTKDYKNICNKNKKFKTQEQIMSYIRDELCNTSKENIMFDQTCINEIIGKSDSEIRKLIRNETIRQLNGINKYIGRKGIDPEYILEKEVNLWFRSKELEDISNKNLTDITNNLENITDIYSNALNSEEYKTLSDILTDNYRFQNCIDEILYTGDDDKEMIEDIKSRELKNYKKKHYKYIEKKLDRLISIRPSDLQSCFKLINNVDEYICKGMLSTSVFNIINMIINLFGVKIDLYKINKESSDYHKLKKLIDIIIPRIPTFMKRLIDLSKYFEKIYCDGKISSTTLILEKINNDIISKQIDVQYNLLDNYNINFSFFDDFTKNIYGKIVLLIFVSFLISKLL
tara:strand:+ start:7155 stop:8792 length:1638 start_codon:yes stop_codon:yes gene_type:complete